MDVIDSIVEQQRCSSYFIFNSGQCNGVISFADTPLLNMNVTSPLAADFVNAVAPQNLVKIISIGPDTDGDDVIDRVEDAGPNGGDGNSDRVPDSTQPYVASLTDPKGAYITVESPPIILLRSLQFKQGLDLLAQADPISQLNGLNFAHGFLEFEVSNIVQGDGVDIKIILPKGEAPVTYYKFGPTPGNPENHLYEFQYDGKTGAEINGNIITLHLIDGERGDGDLIANGTIVDPGAPALRAEIAGAPSGGGGGCTIANESHKPAQAGAWWLLLGLLCLNGIRQGCKRNYRKNLVGPPGL
jgi:hypothetical protein